MRRLELAERVIELRERVELTQEAAAKKAGVGVTTWSNIETGAITRPHARTLIKMARALGVAPEVIMEGSYPKGATSLPDSEEAALAELTRNLARRGRRIVEHSRREGPSEFLGGELREYTAEALAVRRLLGGRDLHGRQSEELADAVDAFEQVESEIQRLLSQDIDAEEEEKAQAQRFRKRSTEDSYTEERGADAS